MLKETEAEHPGAELKAIQDDITIIAPPEVAWAALSHLRAGLENALGLKVNLAKCNCFGTTPEACADKPDWLQEPSRLLDKTGNVLAEARGISICNCPIGEPLYVKSFLRNKFKDICSAIEASSSALNASSSHADFLAFHYSYQALSSAAPGGLISGPSRHTTRRQKTKQKSESDISFVVLARQ